eukprot:TRINITY_DN11551_c0_g2_i1.p2 TRINITY_DN11551_c0_g2~~TRINITY_DN11551_c0_g2_i1.p2  ORF type:complete len:104 (+),score=16.30 TRINITY_DN11551_c0_g2_i1:64-375(+)
MAESVPKVEEVFDDEPEGTSPPVVQSKPAATVEDEEDLPALEPVSQPEEANKANKQSRSEKKSRKAVSRLGLKPVPDVLVVRVKKRKIGALCNKPTRRVQESC